MRFSDYRNLKEFARPFDIRLGNRSDRVQAAAEAIGLRWPDIVPDVSEEDGLARLRRMATLHRKNNWEGVRRSDILIAARVAFSTQWIDEERLSPFREFLIEQLEINDWAGLRRVMFGIHLSSYSPGSRHTLGMVRAIDRCRNGLGLTEQQLLKSVPELLDPIEAPGAIARRLIQEASPRDALRQWGLKENYDDGLMFLIHQSLCKQFESLLAQESTEQLSRFLDWLRPEGVTPRKRGAGMAIDAALKPWTNRAPRPDYQSVLISGLVNTYGDPRIHRSAAWEEASDTSVELIRRWLTGETMTTFLDAISSTNGEAMWKPRRKFWMGLYENGSIDEAWVAFSDEAYRAAQRMAKSEHERRLYKSFGRQIARGGRTNTSLLIMRIGNRVIVEGSHSYKVQLFEKSNRKIPELYKPTYNCEVIRLSSDEDKMHAEGSWQHWVRQKVL